MRATTEDFKCLLMRYLLEIVPIHFEDLKTNHQILKKNHHHFKKMANAAGRGVGGKRGGHPTKLQFCVITYHTPPPLHTVYKLQNLQTPLNNSEISHQQFNPQTAD